MTIKLLKCGICSHWHSPHAHHNHCPSCGAVAVWLGKTVMHYNRVSMLVMKNITAKTIPAHLFQ